ncbi:hypothetical protein LCGC14_1196690 [marine sediment metagenome]|uniref:Uncharacterized protein n=1 Tax=marine sediment metagenome TaxID=412755 RepID=A0A0F9M5F2_9ZZZZ
MYIEKDETMDETEIWESLTDIEKLGATAFIFKKISEHGRESGSFRFLIYARLGFDTDAYSVLLESGGLDISNNLVIPPKED